jgi:hypothetical protein
VRAVLSTPLPGPVPTMNSIGVSGFQSAATQEGAANAQAMRTSDVAQAQCRYGVFKFFSCNFPDGSVSNS